MSVFQAELDIATINFNKTLEVECQKLFAATNYTIATAETISGGIVGNTLKSITAKNNNYIASIVCDHPRAFKKFFALQVDSNTIFSESMTIAMAKGIAQTLGTNICLSCTGAIGYPDEQKVSSAKIMIGFYFNHNEVVKTLNLMGTKQVVLQQVLQAALAYLKNYFVKFSNINESKEAINE